MNQTPLSAMMLSAIETELHRALDGSGGSNPGEIYPLLAYHMGWESNLTGNRAAGKRVRPLLLLLTNAAAEGNWQHALPAAAAVELIHNFSLIHDDIEDDSPLRRGRPTVWNKWGVPMAINAGDAMFTLAHLSMGRLAENISSDTTLKAALLLQNTCLSLTIGQHQDMTFETLGELSLDDYWQMVTGKTASLIAACTELGALVAEVEPSIQRHYQEFGYNLGLAFQALDDILGIWGDVEATGKSVESDLVSSKKTLPVIYALNQKGAFADRWWKGPIQPHEVPELAHLLEIEGARDYSEESAACFTDQALAALSNAAPVGEAAQALFELAGQLLRRKI